MDRVRAGDEARLGTTGETRVKLLDLQKRRNNRSITKTREPGGGIAGAGLRTGDQDRPHAAQGSKMPAGLSDFREAPSSSPRREASAGAPMMARRRRKVPSTLATRPVRWRTPSSTVA